MSALFDKLNNKVSDSASMDAALERFSKAVVNTQACFPKDGKELIAAIKNKCMYIRLAAGKPYALVKTTLNITYPVAIVGDPFNNPIIDGRKTQRPFNILPGGFLDLQFVRLYRGTEFAIGTGANNILFLRGAAMIIQPGGGANILGVIFTVPPENTFDVNLKGVVMAGGQILMFGGVLTVTDSAFINQHPTSGRIPLCIGGDILLLGGVLINNAVVHTQIGGLVVGLGVSGLFVNIMGGVGIFNGCVYSRSLGANFVAGAGIQHFIGAGVGIFSGCVFNTNGGLFAFFGAAVHQFLGAGVMINSGVVSNFNFGLNIACGIGPFITVGAGVHHSSGAVYNINSGAGFLAIDGGQVFLGAGHASFVGCVFNRIFGMLSAWGIGGTTSNHAGDMQTIGVPTAVVVGLSATGFLSLQKFQAVGSFYAYRSPSIRVAAVYLRLGQGIVVWMGAGNMTITDCRDAFRGALGYFNKPQYKFYIAAHTVAYKPVKNLTPLLKPAHPHQTKTPHHTPKPTLNFNPGVLKRLEAKEAKDGSKRRRLELIDEVQAVVTEPILEPEEVAEEPVAITSATYSYEGDEVVPAINLLETVESHVTVTGWQSDDCDTPTIGGGGQVSSCSITDSDTCADEVSGGLPDVCTDAVETQESFVDISEFESSGNRFLAADASDEELVNAKPINVGGSIYITRAEVIVTCEDESCADTDAFKEIMASYLNLDAKTKLAVSADVMDPLVADLLTGDEILHPANYAAVVPTGDDKCSALASYNVYVVTKDDNKHKAMIAALAAINEDAENAAILGELKKKDMLACLVAGKVTFDFGVPLIDTKTNAVGDTSSASITPAISVLDASGVKSVDELVPGQVVSLSLSKFPTDQVTTVTLMDATGKVAATIGGVTPSSNKDIIQWTVPADQEPGLYSFSAVPTLAPNVVAMSKLVQVKDI